MKIVKMSDVERTEGTAPLFTGPVGRQAILDPDDSNNFNFGIVHFGAGVRNKFHTHSGDQILIVTEGTGIVATRDEEVTVNRGRRSYHPRRRRPLARLPGNRHVPHHHHGEGQPDSAERRLVSFRNRLLTA